VRGDDAHAAAVYASCFEGSLGASSMRAELSLHGVEGARAADWAAFLGRVLPLCAAGLSSLNLSRNQALSVDVGWFGKHCPHLEALFLNGTGLRGDAAGFKALPRLRRLDVADCPALTGDPAALPKALGHGLIVNC